MKKKKNIKKKKNPKKQLKSTLKGINKNRHQFEDLFLLGQMYDATTDPDKKEELRVKIEKMCEELKVEIPEPPKEEAMEFIAKAGLNKSFVPGFEKELADEDDEERSEDSQADEPDFNSDGIDKPEVGE